MTRARAIVAAAAVALLAGGCALLQPRTTAARRGVDEARASLAALDAAIQAYIADHGAKPLPWIEGVSGRLGGGGIPWWGFGPLGLDQPVANSPFIASDLEGFWTHLGNEPVTPHPPIYVRDSEILSMWPRGAVISVPNVPAGVLRVPVPEDWTALVRDTDYVLIDPGPDGVAGTLWGGPVVYDPTNGALSYGDIFLVRRAGPDKQEAIIREGDKDTRTRRATEQQG